jgi:hypothetical protein
MQRIGRMQGQLQHRITNPNGPTHDPTNTLAVFWVRHVESIVAHSQEQ